MHRDFVVHTDVKELVSKFVEAASEAAGVAEAKLASLSSLCRGDKSARS
jgi:hypothetical protein